jgi:phosphoserine phosphatase
MLAVVGHPAAVNPDLRLRNVARAYEWPILSTTEA